MKTVVKEAAYDGEQSDCRKVKFKQNAKACYLDLERRDGILKSERTEPFPK